MVNKYLDSGIASVGTEAERAAVPQVPNGYDPTNLMTDAGSPGIAQVRTLEGMTKSPKRLNLQAFILG